MFTFIFYIRQRVITGTAACTVSAARSYRCLYTTLLYLNCLYYYHYEVVMMYHSDCRHQYAVLH